MTIIQDGLHSARQRRYFKIMRTLAGSQIENLMIHNHDAQAYVLFLAWEVLQSHPTFTQKYSLGTFGSFWRDVAFHWRDSLDVKLQFIRKHIEGRQEQFNFYMGQFKQLEEFNEVDMSMNFSEYFKNPHESVVNFLKMESRDEREAVMSSVFLLPKNSNIIKIECRE